MCYIAQHIDTTDKWFLIKLEFSTCSYIVASLNRVHL